MKTITTVKDPVCGMDVDPEQDRGHSEFKGQTYHFCGNTCKEKFDSNPAQYAGKTAAGMTRQPPRSRN
ncbi:MAG TPA: YHS domain-containing protein [Bryobacteraceae bacterium]